MLYFTLISNFGNDIAIVEAGSRYHLSLIFEYFAITFYIIYRMTRRITHNNSTRQEFFYRARCSEINHSTSRDPNRAARKRVGLVSELRNYLPHIGQCARASQFISSYISLSRSSTLHIFLPLLAYFSPPLAYLGNSSLSLSVVLSVRHALTHFEVACPPTFLSFPLSLCSTALTVRLSSLHEVCSQVQSTS